MQRNGMRIIVALASIVLLGGCQSTMQNIVSQTLYHYAKNDKASEAYRNSPFVTHEAAQRRHKRDQQNAILNGVIDGLLSEQADDH